MYSNFISNPGKTWSCFGSGSLYGICVYRSGMNSCVGSSALPIKHGSGFLGLLQLGASRLPFVCALIPHEHRGVFSIGSQGDSLTFFSMYDCFSKLVLLEGNEHP